jgi:hypothetical protein
MVPVFAKTSTKRSFSMIEKERFGLVFAKTGSLNSGQEYTPIAHRLIIQHVQYVCMFSIAY